MTRPVVFFQIWGKDPDRLREFYREIFGWKIDEPDPMGISMIEHGIGGPPEGVGGSIMAGAEALGGRRVMEPFDVPDGPTVAQMADPEGNVIGLVKQ